MQCIIKHSGVANAQDDPKSEARHTETRAAVCAPRKKRRLEMSRGGTTQTTRDAMSRALDADASRVATPPPAKKPTPKRRVRTTSVLRPLGFLRFLKPKVRYGGVGFFLGFSFALWFGEHVYETRIREFKEEYKRKRETSKRMRKEAARIDVLNSVPIIEEIDDDDVFGADDGPKDIGTSEDEHKMVLLVREDLPMGGGKVGSQCAHAAIGAYQALANRHAMLLGRWEADGQKKVTLGVKTLKKFDEIVAAARGARLPVFVVEDAGRTQVDPGTKTVCAIGPAPAQEIDKITGHLRLY